MKYPLCTYGHPILRKKAEPIGSIDLGLSALARDMLEVMTLSKGIGLAAQQIGKTISICVINFDSAFDVEEEGGTRLNPQVPLPLVMVNPEIVEKKGTWTDREGCLSVPDIWAPVQRAYEISVHFVNLEGKSQDLSVQGFLARVIQHELDHLGGVLFVDRMSPVKKITLSGKLKKLKIKTEEAWGLKSAE